MARARRRKRSSGIIHSWSDLAGLIEQVALERTTWIFRGEPSDTYELRPACGRQGDARGTVRHIDVRIAAQRSVFTVHPDPTAAFDFPGLHSWTISRQACIDLKLILDSCAINYASMFPDIEGLARHVGWRYRWGMSQGHVPA